jgi:hypothetical protein
MSETAVDSADITTLTPFVQEHNRVFDLEILEAAIGVALGRKVATIIARHLGSIARDTAVTRWGAFRRYWEWLAASTQAKPFRESTQLEGRIASARDLETITHLWFDEYLASTTAEIVTVAENVNHLGRCLDVLAEHRLFPKIRRPKMPRNYHRTARKRKSLVEIPASAAPANVSAALSTIRQKVPEIAAIEGGEDYLRTLAAGTDVSKLRSTNDIIEAIQALNTDRLAALRKIAEDRLLRWRGVFEEGQELREGSSPNFVEFVETYLHCGTDFDARDLVEKKYFGGQLEKNSNVLKRSFVQYVYLHCDGVCPREPNFFGGKAFFRRLAILLGGRDYFKGWFGAHEDAVAAAALIYLIDSGANISVVLGFTLSWEEPCDERGHVKISGVKDRAGHKPIIEILPIKEPGTRVSAVEALRVIKTMTDPYRKQNALLNDTLFVQSYFSPAALTDEILANRLSYFRREHPMLKDVSLLPSHIRPSVLLQATLERNGSVLAARAMADHGRDAGVTEGYTMRYPTRLLYVRMIRDFQDQFQISIIYDIPGAIKFLGLSEPDAELLLEKAHRSGFGFSCKNPKAGIQAGTTAGETCGKIESCLNCPMIIFYATEDNIADLILFRDHLRQHQPEWEATREERWNAVWLPYLAFAEVVIEKLRRGPQAASVPKAEAVAAQRKAQGYQFLPLF